MCWIDNNLRTDFGHRKSRTFGRTADGTPVLRIVTETERWPGDVHWWAFGYRREGHCLVRQIVGAGTCSTVSSAIREAKRHLCDLRGYLSSERLE